MIGVNNHGSNCANNMVVQLKNHADSPACPSRKNCQSLQRLAGYLKKEAQR